MRFMRSPNSIIFKRIEKSPALKEFRKVLKGNSYTNENREGYIIRDEGNDFLTAEYIFHVPVVVNVFDPERLELRPETNNQPIIVKFTLDFGKRLIMIYSKTGLPRLLTNLGKIADFDMIIGDIDFDIPWLMRQFNKSDFDLNITSLRIRNFPYDVDIIGTYSIRVGSLQAVRKLIELKKGEITYVGGIVELDDEKLNMGFYTDGSIRLYGESEDSDEFLDNIIDVLFGVER